MPKSINLLLPLAFFALAACASGGNNSYSQNKNSDRGIDATGGVTTQVPDTSERTAESRLAKSTLNALQTPSFSNNAEYCGYIVRNAAGKMVATTATKGGFESCLAAEPAASDVILASYHTHGAFDADTPAEFPSTGDVRGDEDEGIDGYISTPGGRLWFVDGSRAIVRQLCGVGCLKQDPNFVEGLDGDIEPDYNLRQLGNAGG